MARLGAWLVAHGRVVIGVVLAATVAFAALAVQLRLDFRYGDLLPLQSQVLLAFGAAVVLTWILLYRYFRDWRGALRPTISGGLAAIWGFGLVQLVGFALNPLTLVIPFLITARAVSHSAQMHDRYYEELAAGSPKADAVQRCFSRLAAPTLAGILTDAFGVLAIAIVAIPALRALAVVAALWLLSLVVTELLLNPIVYARLRAPDGETIRAREQGLLARGCRALAAAVTGPRGRWVALLLSGAVAAGAAVLLPRLQIGDPVSASRILAADSEFNRSHAAVQEKFGGSEPFLVVVEGDRPRALYRPSLLKAMEQLQRHLERLPVVGGSISPVDIMRNMRERFNELEILRSDALMTTASFAVILVVTALTYRSLVAALLLTAPLALANVVVNAYMAARGIGLDVDTLPVIAVGVGFGIDYGIYILSRVRERTAAGTSLDDAVREAIAGAGRTVAFTALAMTAGVLCFTLTALRFVAEMALLLALWMATSAATALLTMPAALVVLRPRFLAGPGVVPRGLDGTPG